MDYKLVERAVKASGFKITEVVSGHARGVDCLGELWADNHDIPCRIFEADWNKHGRSAGPIRNREMADYGEALIALRRPQSRGTQHMIDTARKLGLKVFVVDVE